MKKRILAAFLAVAMVAGICIGAGAEMTVMDVQSSSADMENAVVYEEDFEGVVDGAWSDYSTIVDPENSNNNVFYYQDDYWGRVRSGFLLENCNTEDTYTIMFKVYGDAYETMLGGGKDGTYTVYASNGEKSKWIIVGAPIIGDNNCVYERKLAKQWDTYAVTFSGHTQYMLIVQTCPESMDGVYGGTVLLDDIVVYKGDYLDECNALIEATKPTPEPTPEIIIPTIDPLATPVDLFFDFNDGVDGWYTERQDVADIYQPTGGIDDSGVMVASSKVTELVPGSSSYYDVGRLIPGNTYKLSATVKLASLSDINGGDLFIDVLKCVYYDEYGWVYEREEFDKVWGEKSYISLGGYEMRDTMGPNLHSYFDVDICFKATEMDPRYYLLDSTEFPPYKIKIRAAGSPKTDFYIDNLHFRDVSNLPEYLPEEPRHPMEDGLLYWEDFEGNTARYWKAYDEDEVDLNKDFTIHNLEQTSTSHTICNDPFDANNKVFSIRDTTANPIITNSFFEECEYGKEYTLVMRVLGDTYSLGVTEHYLFPGSAFMGEEEIYGDLYTTGHYESEAFPVWKTLVTSFDNRDYIQLCLRLMSTQGFMDGQVYIDDIRIYEGDVVREKREEVEREEASSTPPLPIETTRPAERVCVYENDFEDESDVLMIYNDLREDYNNDVDYDGEQRLDTFARIDVDTLDSNNHAMYIKDNLCYLFTSNTLIQGLDTQKEYTMAIRLMGDVGRLGMTTDGTWNISYDIINEDDDFQPIFEDTTLPIWKTFVFKFTRMGTVKLVGEVYPWRDSVFDRTIAIDDIKIYEGDIVEEINAEVNPTPIPTPVVTPKPTATPTSTPTPAVTTTATQTATATPAVSVNPTVDPTKKPIKKSIKFKKKSVKIKRGKKATLKVKITGAKKAKFSVDKKGKKVVKLMKKKAKSVVVKGKKKGKAVITAKAAGKKAKCKVTVR